jgi:hypothetical protein
MTKRPFGVSKKEWKTWGNIARHGLVNNYKTEMQSMNFPQQLIIWADYSGQIKPR